MIVLHNHLFCQVIFTLESELSESGVGRVVGRKVVDIRICSCPKRDRQQEEQRAQQQEEQARRIAQRYICPQSI